MTPKQKSFNLLGCFRFMDSLTAAILGISAILTLSIPVLCLIAGIYVITALKQNQLTVRESIRSQRAMARLQSSPEGGEMNLADIAMQFLPLLMQKGQLPGKPQVEQSTTLGNNSSPVSE